MDLETLQYDLLYGKRYSYGESGESPYLRTRMRMGIYDVTLDSIQCISEADHTYYIKGTEFTPSSEIKLNGEWYDTVYINPTTLMITGTELNDFFLTGFIEDSMFTLAKRQQLGNYIITFQVKEGDYAETYRVKDADGKNRFLKTHQLRQTTSYSI